MSLKHLLNDDGPDQQYELQPPFDRRYRLPSNTNEILDESISHLFNQSLGFQTSVDTDTADFGLLEGADHIEFNPNDDIEQWAFDTIANGPYDHSPLPSSESTSDSDGLREEQNTASRSNPAAVDQRYCFGMIHRAEVKLVGDMTLLDNKLKPSSTTILDQRFSMKDKSEHILLSFPDGTDFGYLSLRVTKGLTELLNIKTLTFDAVTRTDDLRDIIGKAQKPSDAPVRVDINIYGPLDKAKGVGDHLSTHRLWLQTPDRAIRDTPYKNPQFLEFDNVDISVPDVPTEVLSRGQAKPRTEEEHLRKAVTEIYGASKRQDGLTQAVTHSGRIKTQMLAHQEQALGFMLQREDGDSPERFRLWKKKVVENVTTYQHSITKTKSRIQPDEKGGGILADEMGMGKSLSILALIVETLDKGRVWANERKALSEGSVKIYAPSTLVIVSSALLINNWCHEIDTHLKGSLNVIRYHGPDRPKSKDGLDMLGNSDVVITTYNTLAKEWTDKGTHKSSLLHDIEWYRVVLDEAHIIRRQATSFHRTCAELKANSRWCLTGTPIQNKLEDIGALFCFIKASQFESMAAFRRYVVVPFDQGDDETAVKRLAELNDSLCLRRTKDILDLPNLQEIVVRLDFNEEERKQYENTKNVLFRKIRLKAGEHERTNQFNLFQVNLQLRIMCNHGTFQKPFSWHAAPGSGSISTRNSTRKEEEEAIMATLGSSMQIKCNGCSQPMPVQGTTTFENGFVDNCKHVFCQECLDDTVENGPQSQGRRCPLCERFGFKPATTSGHQNGPENERGEETDVQYFRNEGYSTKMKALVSDVQRDLGQTKSIVFSCWTRTLNLVGRHLDAANINFARIDGETALGQRQSILDNFAEDSGPPVLVMTTGTGAFGLNLTCASRVFIVELQWNPSVERQAIARAIRLGQQQQVTVTRYIMNDTVEHDMQSQQNRKLMMAKKGFYVNNEMDVD